jgi:hypothetical protein
MRPFVHASILNAGLLLLCSPLHAEPRRAVVELFTSQGCSSCPPADAYVGELAQRPDVLALSFHVDYWDDLGWRDRFDSPEATARQRRYADAMNLPSVYTPQVVIDGHENFVGSDRRSIGQSLGKPRGGIPVAIAIREHTVLIDLAATAGVPSSDVLLVAYRHSATSAIGRGENSGRTLTEYNIVRSVRRLGNYTGEAREYGVDTGSLPTDATDVAVLVQQSDQGPVVAAASRSLQ